MCTVKSSPNGHCPKLLVLMGQNVARCKTLFSGCNVALVDTRMPLKSFVYLYLAKMGTKRCCTLQMPLKKCNVRNIKTDQCLRGSLHNCYPRVALHIYKMKYIATRCSILTNKHGFREDWLNWGARGAVGPPIWPAPLGIWPQNGKTRHRGR